MSRAHKGELSRRVVRNTPTKTFEAGAAQFGGNVRRRREALELTQAALSERAGIDLRHVQRLESGGGNPTLRLIADLADALQCSIGDLFSGPLAPNPRGRGRPPKPVDE